MLKSLYLFMYVCITPSNMALELANEGGALGLEPGPIFQLFSFCVAHMFRYTPCSFCSSCWWVPCSTNSPLSTVTYTYIHTYIHNSLQEWRMQCTLTCRWRECCRSARWRRGGAPRWWSCGPSQRCDIHTYIFWNTLSKEIFERTYFHPYKQYMNEYIVQ